MSNLENTLLLLNNQTFYSCDIEENRSFEECSICFEDIDESNKKILECGHTFHTDCINKWTKVNPICPYCRKYMQTYFNCSCQ